MARRPAATEVCPNCGATFKSGRLACPECGSDANTGWKSQEEIDYSSVDIPDPDGDPDARPGLLPKPLMIGVAVLVIVLLVFFFVLGGRL